MRIIDAAKLLIAAMGSGPELDEALRMAALALLDHAEEELALINRVEEEPVKKEPERKKRQFDTGKLKALRDGGWSVAKIADEMRVSEQTVRNHMKANGIR